jgi:E3 ubiquitin-protein ligase BIG BROTHER-like protein
MRECRRSCLVCRCCFERGEEIKSLPCFHSYHSDCIDSWLSLNKVCPVCQFSIDQTN